MKLTLYYLKFIIHIPNKSLNLFDLYVTNWVTIILIIIISSHHYQSKVINVITLLFIYYLLHHDLVVISNNTPTFKITTLFSSCPLGFGVTAYNILERILNSVNDFKVDLDCLIYCKFK